MSTGIGAQTSLKESGSVAGLIRFGRAVAPTILMLSDYITLVAALWATYAIRVYLLPQFIHFRHELAISPLYIYMLIPMIYIALFIYEGMYQKRLIFWENTAVILKISLMATGLSIGMIYFAKTAHEISRTFIALSCIVSFFFLSVSRLVTKRALASWRIWQKPVVLLGSGTIVNQLVEAFRKEPTLGYEVVGLVTAAVENIDGCAVLGDMDQAERVVRASGVRDVIIACPHLEHAPMMNMVYRIQPLVENLILVPNLSGIPMTNMEIEKMLEQRLVLLRIKNNMTRAYNRFLKRTFEGLAGLGTLIFLVPVFLVLAVLIRLDSPGPVIFAHERVGYRGKRFRCYKFRTMVANADEVFKTLMDESAAAREEWARDFKLRDDPRLTRVGKWLRKTSLDELPQIFNVIKGEMSLVGPRPIVEKEIEKYGETIHDYYLVRPGITGYWQVNGRNDVDYQTRIGMDAWYVRNWTIWLDIDIILRTFQVVLKKDGAY